MNRRWPVASSRPSVAAHSVTSGLVPRLPVRVATARESARAAREALSSCRLCAHLCGADRSKGPAGLCGAGPVGRVFHEGIEWAGEAELVPTYVVSFAGCNMTCRFCLTGGPSQDASRGDPFEPDAIAARIATARPELRSVTILGGEPSIHLPSALELVARLPEDLPLVWKTNAFSSGEALDLLGVPRVVQGVPDEVQGVPDFFLADLKFGNDECARRIAGVNGYLATVHENLRRAARSRLIVRHLLMPGHVACCLEPAVAWLVRELPGTPLSLMTAFLPVHESASAGLGRTNSRPEVEDARRVIAGSGIALVPWSLAERPTSRVEPRPATAELWIDRGGNVCVDSAPAELVRVLKRLAPELRLAGEPG